MNKFEKSVLDTIKKYNMIQEGDRVLVGLSGGKDSAVLVYTLVELSRILKCEITAFHVNHMIRGEEAERDEAFSKNFAEKLGIRFSSVRVDVPHLSKNSTLGLEAVARQARYDAFQAFAESNSITKIATAHTLSDNSETVIMSLFRNATLSPIPPVRGNIIRPLIELTSEEVVSYAKEMQVDFVFDSTNSRSDYLRNFTRLEVLPVIRERVLSFDETLLRAGEIYSSLKSFVRGEAEAYFVNRDTPESLSCLTPLALDDSKHALLFEVLSRIFEKNSLTLTYERFEKILKELKSPRVGTSFSIDGEKSLFIGYDKIYFDTQNKDREPFYIKLGRGENKIPSSPYTLFVETADEYEERSSKKDTSKQKINKLTKKISIPYNIINGAFYSRSRETGDFYVCGGITRNIKKYMIDSKIPKSVRHLFPVVCDGEGIVWVPGLGIADRLKEKSKDSNLYLSLSIDKDSER